jgi:hypothetical protein
MSEAYGLPCCISAFVPENELSPPIRNTSLFHTETQPSPRQKHRFAEKQCDLKNENKL